MIEINLKVDVVELRNIYFRDNRQKYFFGPGTKRQSLYLVVAIAVFPFFVMHALNSTYDRWYFVLGSIFFSLLVYDYWKVARPIIKWKKSILNFLEKVKHTQTLTFHYNETYYIHTQDSQQLKQNWSAVEQAIIDDQCIWLLSDKNILLPKSSMRNDEYNALSQTIMNQVQHVERNYDASESR